MKYPMPGIDEYVNAYLHLIRGNTVRKTVFTQAGKQVIHEDGDQLIYGPNGAAIRVIEKAAGGTQVETDHGLHAVVRPQTLTLKVS